MYIMQLVHLKNLEEKMKNINEKSFIFQKSSKNLSGKKLKKKI